MTSERLRRRFSRVVSSAYLFFVGAFLVHATYVAWCDQFSVPHWDDWRILDDMFAQPLLQWIFTDQVGHRVPIMLFLVHLDYALLQGKLHLLVGVALLCTWLTLVVLYLGLRGKDLLQSPVQKVGLAFLGYCLFWAASCHDLVWGMNQATRMTLMLLVLSLALLSRCHDSAIHDPGPGKTRLVVGAGVAAFLASFNHGIGMACWASVIVTTVVARFSWRLVVAYAVSASLTFALYVFHLANAPRMYGSTWDRVALLWQKTTQVTAFLAAFLGAPVLQVAVGLGWTDNRPLHELSVAAGGVGVGALAAYLWWLRRPSRVDSWACFAVGLTSFALAGGVIVTLNRWTFASAATSIRYVSWTTLFWMGLAAACVSVTVRARRWAWTVLVALPVVSVAMLPALERARDRLQHLAAQDEIAAAMHLSGVQWDARARHPSSGPIYRVVERLRSDRHGFFANRWGDLTGDRLDEHFTRTSRKHCTGTVRSVASIQARGGPAAEVYGRAWDLIADSEPALIVTADAEQIIRGVGLVVRRPTLRHLRNRPARARAAPWVAFVDGFDPSQRYAAFAVLADGRAACLVALFGSEKIS